MTDDTRQGRQTGEAYELETNAAGGGTREQTDAAYDHVGTGGEGISPGAATDYRQGHPATDSTEHEVAEPVEPDEAGV